MRFASSISGASSVSSALEELLGPLQQRVTAGAVDAVMLFATGHFFDAIPEVVNKVSGVFPNSVVMGCTAEGTIGYNREIERTPSISLLAGCLPDVVLRPFHMTQNQLETARTADHWERLLGVSAESRPTFVAFGDPFRMALHAFVDRLNEVYPGCPLVGGVASSGDRPHRNYLVANGELHTEGIVGLSLTGPLRVDTVVSQGCRPIGRPFVITRSERNVVVELGGKPALERLHEVIVNLSGEEEQLARQSLFVGRVINEYQEVFTRGDFLIQNIIGVDRKSGAIAIAGNARKGATVQFQVRDAETADEDLRALLAPHGAADVKGALMFGCNGRGTHMWPSPGHDIGVFRDQLGDVPCAGFFCGGEFGPIGGKNFIHGFTASLALFREGTEPVSTIEPDAPG